MLKSLTQTIIKKLWHQYCAKAAQIRYLHTILKKKCGSALPLDHFAIIDLPGIHTGIPHLHELFSALGYETRGQDYLAAKHNDFLWMAEKNAALQPASTVLPQVVIADFRLEALPKQVAAIITKYASAATPLPRAAITYWLSRLSTGSEAHTKLEDLILTYLSGRDWPLPTIKEFKTVHECNELLAWVLVHGRKPNHFTLSIHLQEQFADLNAFNQFIVNETHIPLNHEGGVLKGGEAVGIAQSSTIGAKETIRLADGEIELPGCFIEFVWRYPHTSHCLKPQLWQDYFTDFIAQHADNVIESLYVEKII